MNNKQILQKLISFTLPLILSGLLQQMFSWVDAFIVGNILGENALAAIGVTSIIHTLFLTLLIGFTSGLSILFAQSYGSGNMDKIRNVLSQYVFLLGIIFTVFSIIGIFTCDSILVVLDTPSILMEDAKTYGIIMFLGIPFLTFYNVYASAIRGIGNSKVPFYAVLISSVINVVLDYLFVGVFPYGVAGAAIATLISQIAMTIYVIYYFIHTYPKLRVSLFNKIDIETLKEGMMFGFPPTIQSGVISVGNMILQKFMNGFGEHTVAAITTAYRIDSVLLLPITNFGTGVATLVAHSIGANNKEEAKKIMKLGFLVMVPISLCLTSIIYVSGEYLVGMFGLTSVSIAIGKEFFNTISIFYIVCALFTVFRGYLEGCGDLVFAGIMGVVSLVVRILCSYAFVGVFGTMVVAYAEAFSWIFLLIGYSIRYFYSVKNDIKR